MIRKFLGMSLLLSIVAILGGCISADNSAVADDECLENPNAPRCSVTPTPEVETPSNETENM